MRSVIALSCVMFGCATAGAGGGGGIDSRPVSRSTNVLTRAEIAERAPTARTVLEAIRLARSSWLRPAGFVGFRPGSGIVTYIDNIRLGDVNSLDQIDLSTVHELRFFSAPEATTRWGTGNAEGAIEVVTQTAARSVGQGTSERAPRRGAGTGGDPESPTFVFKPYEPFNVTPVLYLNGASSIVSAPVELGDFWDPIYGFGAGFGLTATRSVTVFALAEYNRYEFQAERLISFLERSSGPRLRSRDGVEASGEPLSILNLSGNVKFHPHWRTFAPYVMGGVGYLRLNAGQFSMTGPGGTSLPPDQFRPGRADGGGDLENAVSISMGAGFDLNLGSVFRLFTDGRYVIAFRGPRYNDVTGDPQLDNTQYFPFRFGMAIRLQGVSLGRT